MLKVVVFDTGSGGESVADFLATEIKTIEIIRVITWQQPPYNHDELMDFCWRVERNLSQYVDKVDLVVLGGYISSLTIDFLRKRHPQQKFVAMGVSPHYIPHQGQTKQTVAMFANALLFRTEFWDSVCQSLPYFDTVLPSCYGWESLIDIDEMSEDLLRVELQDLFRLIPTTTYPSLSQSIPDSFNNEQGRIARFVSVLDTVKFSGSILHGRQSYQELQPMSRATIEPNSLVFTPTLLLILNTHFWTIESKLQRLFGPSVKIIDFRWKLLHDVCLALNLRGLDGRLGE